MYKFFFFNDTATTEIYTLSLHDALPIYDFKLALTFERELTREHLVEHHTQRVNVAPRIERRALHLLWRYVAKRDRKSTRLNSSHQIISYAVFSLKKKKRSDITDPLHTHS